jgi:hypothetical protein
MGGRSFSAYNKRDPECIERLAADVPACFDAVIWRLYLVDSFRAALNDPAERMALSRGQAPAYCQDCTVGHRAKMQAAGRCNPPPLPASAQAQLELVDARA